MLDDPVGRRIVESCAGAGEQARMLAGVPVKMKLADQASALLPLTPTGTAAALVIKAPVTVAALREYFAAVAGVQVLHSAAGEACA